VLDQTPGNDRRLFRISSVSVRRHAAPSSSIQRLAGRPSGTPDASRNARMNSTFGTGSGAATFTTPSTSSRSMSQRIARSKSS
jgi:hypothetical protein